MAALRTSFAVAAALWRWAAGSTAGRDRGVAELLLEGRSAPAAWARHAAPWRRSCSRIGGSPHVATSRVKRRVIVSGCSGRPCRGGLVHGQVIAALLAAPVALPDRLAAHTDRRVRRPVFDTGQGQSTRSGTVQWRLLCTRVGRSP